MKRVLLVMLMSIAFMGVQAQDKIIKLSGEEIICKISEIGENAIKFKYEGEDLTNSIYKNTVKEIVFSSGRVQSLNSKVVVNGEKDWEKVRITKLESDVKGLTRGESISASSASGWSFTSQQKIQAKAIKKLKKLAAKNGYHVVLILTETGKGGHAGISGGTKSGVNGIGYKY